MILRVEIDRDLVQQILTEGYEFKATKITRGLPEGAHLIDARLKYLGTDTNDLDWAVILLFETHGEIGELKEIDIEVTQVEEE